MTSLPKEVDRSSKPYETVEHIAQSYHGGIDEDAATESRRGESSSSLGRAAYLVVVNSLASIIIFGLYLISIESLISIALSVGLTLYVYRETEEKDEFNGNIMNWVLLSFAVVTPITAVISMAFTRRENALRDLGNLRATLLQMYIAHASWDWDSKPKPSGRAQSDVDWRKHCDAVLQQLFGIASDATHYLTLPTCSRARHKIFPMYQNEAKLILSKAANSFRSMNARYAKLSQCCEVLKREGMPGNESSRIRQWERDSLQYFERLRMIKNYRTPQALRSFSRLFSIFLPPFYAPFYAQVAHELNSLGTGIAFAVITSLALTSLFEAIYQLEDPFVPGSVLDGIYLEQLLIRDLVPDLLQLRQIYFPEAPNFDAHPKPFQHGGASTVRLVSE
jgi:hypothetical protein